MAASRTYDLFVGVDIATATAAVAWQHLHATAVAPARTLLVMEATGSYWITLATTLHQAGYAVSVITPARVHAFATALLKRAKSDAIDAQTLTQLAALLQPAPWTPPPAVYHELQQRLAQCDVLLDLRQQVRNQRHALLQHPTVVAAVRERMQSLIASWLLVTTLCFTNCPTPEAATAYAGRAPNERSSGTRVYQRPRIGHTGNARLRTALYRAILSAAARNRVLKPFYDRLRAAGKPMAVSSIRASRYSGCEKLHPE